METNLSSSPYQRLTVPSGTQGFGQMPQGHSGVPGVNRRTIGTRQLASVLVKLEPEEIGHAHVHPYETLVFVQEGWGVTFMGPDADATFQRAGDWLVIPSGVPHVPGNLSSDRVFVALTCRASADPVEEVELLPGMDEVVAERFPGLCERFADGTLAAPWSLTYAGGDPFRL